MITYEIIENILNNNYQYLGKYEEKIRSSIRERVDKRDNNKKKTILKVVFNNVDCVILFRENKIKMMKKMQKIKDLKIEKGDMIFLTGIDEIISLDELIEEYKNNNKQTGKKRKRQTKIDELKQEQPDQKKPKYNRKDEIMSIKETLDIFQRRIISLEDENKGQKKIIDELKQELESLNKKQEPNLENSTKNIEGGNYKKADDDPNYYLGNPSGMDELNDLDWASILDPTKDFVTHKNLNDTMNNYVTKQNLNDTTNNIYKILQTHGGKIDFLNGGLKETFEIKDLVKRMYKANAKVSEETKIKLNDIESEIFVNVELCIDEKINKLVKNHMPIAVKDIIKNNINDILSVLNSRILEDLSENNNIVNKQLYNQQMAPLYNNNSSSAPSIQTTKQSLDINDFDFDLDDQKVLDQFMQEESIY